MDSKKKAWAVWGATYLATIAVALNQFKVVPLMTALMETFNMNKTTAGWLNSVFTIGGVILAIPAAMIMKKFGPKATGFFALASTFTGVVIGALSKSVTGLMIGRTIEGIALGLIAVVAPAVIAMWFKSEERGLPMGLWGTFAGIAFFSILNLAVPISSAFGLQGVWWFGAILAGTALVVWYLVADVPEAVKAAAASAASKEKGPAVSMSKALLNPSSWVVSLMFCVGIFGMYGYKSWAPTYLIETFAISPASANFYTSLISLVGIPTAVLVGWVLDHTPNRKMVAATAFFLSSIFLFFSYRLPGVSVLVPYMIGLAVVIYFIPTCCFTLAPDTMENPAFAGFAIGIATLGQNVGMLMGSPIVGSVIEKSGWGAATIPLAASMAIGCLASLAVKTYRTTPKSVKAQKQAGVEVVGGH
ncbi:MAG: MFS transporter [Anaerolineales bacterium]|nr:MFS transporter [Anaerolineales bacterium]